MADNIRHSWIHACADGSTHSESDVIVAGSYQMSPPTDRPFKVRGVSRTAKTVRHVEIALTRAEAAKLIADWAHMAETAPPQFAVVKP